MHCHLNIVYVPSSRLRLGENHLISYYYDRIVTDENVQVTTSWWKTITIALFTTLEDQQTLKCYYAN